VVGCDSASAGPRSFPSIVSFLDHLVNRGVNGATVVNLVPQSYPGPLVLAQIPGASSTARVTFRSQSGGSRAVFAATSGVAAMRLAGTDYVSFDRVDFAAAGSCTCAVSLSDGACSNELRNCELSGADSTSSGTAAVRVSGGCSFNLLDRLQIGGAFTGVAMQGAEGGALDSNNVVRACAINDARYGVYISRQTGCVVSGNDIVPGSPSTVAAACYGVYVTTLGSGGSAQVCGNRIHGFTDNSGSVSNRAVGVFAAAASGASVLITNNFITDFSAAGQLKINGIYLSYGENTVLHNSIRIGDVGAAGEIAGVYISAGTTHTLKNNIILCLEDDVASYGVWAAQGAGLTADGDDIYGPDADFAVGRIGSTTYAAFSQWQAAGYDQAGISADPGFVSPEDLHIQMQATAVDGRGLYTGLVSHDIDGQVRSNPPDIGADEYASQILPDTVQNITICPLPGGLVQLRWPPAADAARYHVYADSTMSIPLSESSRIGSTTDTMYTDTVSAIGARSRFYTVTADSDSGLPPPLIVLEPQPQAITAP